MIDIPPVVDCPSHYTRAHASIPTCLRTQRARGSLAVRCRIN
uniref:Uncharacterized protein n=1 Tax=Rhizophora mucronata TaxID=61149 RepID=A0A2P2NUE2_RHIMU